MPASSLGPPYGPPANLRTIIETWRDRGVPPIVDRAWFERIGLSGNLATRNLHALRYLRLVDDDNYPTELARRLTVASTDEFRTTLAAIVRTSYARIWAIRDPAGEARERIDDAFRHESPPAQRSRMVACFIGLCTLAGIPVAAETGRGARSARRPLPTRTAPAFNTPAPPPPERAQERESEPAAARGREDVGAMLLRKFPDFDPAWPDGVKEKWFDAFVQLRAALLA